MTSKYILSCILLFCLTVEYGSASDLSRTKVIETAEMLCSGHDICSTNTLQISSIEEASICCLDCSCDPSCKENENCCFPDQAYTIGNDDDEDEKSVTENDTTLVYECLYPLSPQPIDVVEKVRQQSIWMISEIRNKPHLSRYQKCGQREVAPWGSFLPVSSKKTGQIYKNIICAYEHGVKEEDTVVWKGSNICKGRGIKYFDLGEAYLNNCPKHFYPPTGIEIQRSSLCFNNLVDMCPEKDFTVPTDLEMSRSEVISACTSGLVSLYRIYGMFANVFCHICNGYMPGNSLRCFNLPFPFGSEKTKSSISGLINYNFLQSLSRDQDEKREPRLACLAEDTVFKSVAGSCRIIQCPVGQIRNSAGDCFFGTLQWYNVVFKLCIQLTSDKPFNIHHYFPILSGSRQVDISHLKSPFPNYMKIESIYCKQLMSLNDTDELLISIAKQAPITSFKHFLNEVRKGMKKHWKLILQNTTILLKANMARELLLNVHEKNTLTLGKGISYQRIYFKRHDLYITDPIFLTKLYFCQNVQLEDSEFDISDTGILYSKFSNRSLYNAEFSYVKSEQNESCRVCLEDSVFFTNDQDKSIGNTLSLGVFIMFACSLVCYWMMNIRMKYALL